MRLLQCLSHISLGVCCITLAIALLCVFPNGNVYACKPLDEHDSPSGFLTREDNVYSEGEIGANCFRRITGEGQNFVECKWVDVPFVASGHVMGRRGSSAEDATRFLEHFDTLDLSGGPWKDQRFPFDISQAVLLRKSSGAENGKMHAVTSGNSESGSIRYKERELATTARHAFSDRSGSVAIKEQNSSSYYQGNRKTSLEGPHLIRIFGKWTTRSPRYQWRAFQGAGVDRILMETSEENRLPDAGSVFSKWQTVEHMGPSGGQHVKGVVHHESEVDATLKGGLFQGAFSQHIPLQTESESHSQPRLTVGWSHYERACIALIKLPIDQPTEASRENRQDLNSPSGGIHDIHIPESCAEAKEQATFLEVEGALGLDASVNLGLRGQATELHGSGSASVSKNRPPWLSCGPHMAISKLPAYLTFSFSQASVSDILAALDYKVQIWSEPHADQSDGEARRRSNLNKHRAVCLIRRPHTTKKEHYWFSELVCCPAERLCLVCVHLPRTLGFEAWIPRYRG